MVVELTDESFDKEVMANKGCSVVDFWADWCMPCKMMGPMFEEISVQYQNKDVKFFKLNVDKNPQTAGKFNIVGIPTLLIFKDGMVQGQITGVEPKNNIIEKIDSAIKA